MSKVDVESASTTADTRPLNRVNIYLWVDHKQPPLSFITVLSLPWRRKKIRGNNIGVIQRRQIF